MTPLAAALSMRFIAICVAVGAASSAVSAARTALFTRVFISDRTALLRRRRFSFWRLRLIWLLMFATGRRDYQRTGSFPKMSSPRIAVGPDSAPAWVREAVIAGGGQIVDVKDAEAVVWSDPRGVDGLVEILATGEDVRWVQLPWAGVERFAE